MPRQPDESYSGVILRLVKIESSHWGSQVTGSVRALISRLAAGTSRDASREGFGPADQP
jgi:hypothetical protein